jgi:syntaxin-binding protein 1
MCDSQWKVLVLDETSKKLIYNVLKEDDILNENVASRVAIPSRSLRLIWRRH